MSFKKQVEMAEKIDQLREEVKDRADCEASLTEWNQKLTERAEQECKRLTVSRDQWKDACLDSNAMVQGTEAQNKVLRELLDKAVLYWQIGKWTEPVGLDILVQQALKETEVKQEPNDHNTDLLDYLKGKGTPEELANEIEEAEENG